MGVLDALDALDALDVPSATNATDIVGIVARAVKTTLRFFLEVIGKSYWSSER